VVIRTGDTRTTTHAILATDQISVQATIATQLGIVHTGSARAQRKEIIFSPLLEGVCGTIVKKNAIAAIIERRSLN
jgi:hypothetical protein